MITGAIASEAKSSADIAVQREDRADLGSSLRHKRALEDQEMKKTTQASGAKVRKMRLELEQGKATAAAAASETEAARLHIGAVAQADATAKKAEGELAIAKAICYKADGSRSGQDPGRGGRCAGRGAGGAEQNDDGHDGHVRAVAAETARALAESQQLA